MISRRPLGFLDAACLGVNAIVGSSIFLFPGRLAAYMGPASILSFGLTGLLLAAVALCFAEAAAGFDRPGGPYLYAREAFGERLGFGIGWLSWVTATLSLAAVADGVALYLGHFGPAWSSPWIVKGVGASAILVMGAVNYRGVKLGARAADVLTAAKLMPLGLFILWGLPNIRPAHFVPFAPHGLEPLGAACLLAYFAFQGFEVVPVPAGEVESPGRTVPLAVLSSLGLAAVVYMLVQAVAVGVHPGLAGSEKPLAEAAAQFMGPSGAAFMVLAAVVSMVGFVSGASLGAPRYLVALAQDGHIPKALACVHPRFGTPHLAVAATSSLALAAALALDFNRLVDIVNVVIAAQYLATCAAIPVLRRLRPRGGGFRAPGGLAAPAVGAVAALWLAAQGRAAQFATALAFAAIGFIFRASYSRNSH